MRRSIIEISGYDPNDPETQKAVREANLEFEEGGRPDWGSGEHPKHRAKPWHIVRKIRALRAWKKRRGTGPRPPGEDD